MDRFSLAKDWRKNCDDRYNSMLETEIYNGNAGQMYRERHYEERRGVRNDCKGRDEFLHYTDYRFRRLQSPDVRARYSNRGICAKSIDENLKHHDLLALYPEANLNNSQDWPSDGLISTSSRNRYIGNKRIHNAKMVPYYYDGYHQKKHHDSSFFTDNMPQSSLHANVVAETGRCILPVKRKLHDDLESMNYKDIADLSLPKGRRFMHDQSVVSDRKIYPVNLDTSIKESDTKATFVPTI